MRRSVLTLEVVLFEALKEKPKTQAREKENPLVRRARLDR